MLAVELSISGASLKYLAYGLLSVGGLGVAWTIWSNRAFLFGWIGKLRNAKEKTGGLASVGSDTKPPADVGNWLSRYLATAPDAPPEAILDWAMNGKTLMEVVVADRQRVKPLRSNLKEVAP